MIHRFFIPASNFWLTLETSHGTILEWVLVKCSYFWKPYWNHVFQVSHWHQRDRQINGIFTKELFANTNSEWALFRHPPIHQNTKLYAKQEKFKFSFSKYSHIWNQHSRIFQNANFHPKWKDWDQKWVF